LSDITSKFRTVAILVNKNVSHKIRT